MACRSDVGVVKLRHDPHADMRWDSTQNMKIKSRWEGKRENPREAAKQNNAPGLLPLSFFSLRNSNLNLIFLKNKSWKTKKDGHEENVRLVDCNATMTTTRTSCSDLASLVLTWQHDSSPCLRHAPSSSSFLLLQSKTSFSCLQRRPINTSRHKRPVPLLLLLLFFYSISTLIEVWHVCTHSTFPLVTFPSPSN